MPILYNEQTKTFRLDAKDSSYAFRITELGYLVHLYYGAHISDSDLQKLAAITLLLPCTPRDSRFGLLQP